MPVQPGATGKPHQTSLCDARSWGIRAFREMLVVQPSCQILQERDLRRESGGVPAEAYVAGLITSMGRPGGECFNGSGQLHPFGPLRSRFLGLSTREF